MDSPKYFYDERGSALYDQICNTPEYYPTRTELSILQENRDEFAELVKHAGTFIEIGAGQIEKSSTILSRIRTPIHYVAVDIARERLLQSKFAIKKLILGTK